MYFSALLLVILTGIALGENCCGCWDRCFQQSLDADKQLFYNMINKLRGVKIAYDIKGTAYMMDGSTNIPTTTTWEYQKRVAALVALTQEVNSNCPSNCCNRFMTSIYTSIQNINFAYFLWSWQCQDKCQAAQTLLTMPPSTPQPTISTNWIGGSCLLGTIPCPVPPLNRMAIGFMNNNNQVDPPAPWCTDANYRVRVAVKVGVPASPPPGYLRPATSNPADSFEIDVGYTPSRFTTVTNLLRCVRERSCDAPISPVIRQILPMNITYITENSRSPVTKSFSSFEEFNKAMSMVVVTNP